MEMAEEFFLTTQIVGCPTVRTAAGLAESSRNRLLTKAGLARAADIYRILSRADSSEAAVGQLEALGFRVDYVEEHWGRRFAAAYLEGVRLIDNVQVPN
jgi:pantoate--beta-alanine ligase